MEVESSMIEKLFEVTENLSDAKNTQRELSGMRNSQPPKRPTFIINQQSVKREISQKLSDCEKGYGFSHIFLIGRIGGGKTHFLNWIESRLKNEDNYYVVKFQVQETGTVKHSFVRMVVSKLFQVYGDDFMQALQKCPDDLSINYKNDVSDKAIREIIRELEVSSNLAKLLYELGNDKKRDAALRVLAASHGRKEISKLGVTELGNMDYINVIEIFLKYRLKEGFLLILLDEFEHASSTLTNAARTKFYISYKEFIDEASNFYCPAVALISSATEQYQGSLAKDVNKHEGALWSRLEGQQIDLVEFNPTVDAEFNELFNELATRYKIAYEYDVGLDLKLMKKKFLSHIGADSTHAISYRNAISTMLKIMDDLRSRGDTLKSYREENLLDSELQVTIPVTPDVKEKEDRILKEADAKWEEAHNNTKSGMLKTALEKFYISASYEIIKLKKYEIKESGSLLYVTRNGRGRLIYISTTLKPKSLSNQFQKCLNIKDALSEKIENEKFDTLFIYQKDVETETLVKFFKSHPDTLKLSLEKDEILKLLVYADASTVIREKISQKIERVINFILIK